jgi:hypothetical protein
VVTAAASHGSFLVPLAEGGFPSWLAGPLAGIGPRLDQTGFELLVVGMCVCYATSLWLADSLSSTAVIATILAVHVVFVLGPPLMSPDVATYLAYGRMGALHGIDPYTHAAHALPHSDPLHPWVTVQAGATNYGPPFTLITYLIARLSVPAGLWTLKVVAMATSLGIVGLVAACARLRGFSPIRAAVLAGLNPVALIYSLGGAHNDLWMMFVLMAGVWLTLKARRAEGSILGTVATGLKVSVAPATLFMLLGPRARRKTIVVAVATAIVLAVIVLLGFGHGTVFVNYARQLYHGGHAFARRYSVPALIGQALGLHGVHGVTGAVRLVAGAILIASIIALLLALRRGRDWLTLAGWGQLAVLLTTTWLWPWYIVWILPLAPLARDRRLTAAALAVTAFLVVTQVFLPLG